MDRSKPICPQLLRILLQDIEQKQNFKQGPELCRKTNETLSVMVLTSKCIYVCKTCDRNLINNQGHNSFENN